MKRRPPEGSLLAAAGALLVLEVLCFGPHLFKTGFYIDDWVFLDRAFGPGAPGLLGGLRAFCTRDLASRPLEMLHFALLTFAGGMEPWRYRVLNLLGELLLGLALFDTLQGLSGRRKLSLLAASFALAFPSHGATHVWMSQSPQTWAMALCFAGFSIHGRRSDPDSGVFIDWKRLLSSQACYLASLMLYESTFFMPLALAAGYWAAGSRFPRSSPEARRAWIKAMLPFALSAGAFIAYQRLIAPIWLGPSPKNLELSLRHAGRIYLAAASCAATGVPKLLELVRRPIAGTAWWLLMPAGALLVAGFFGGEDPVESGSGKGGRVLWAFGAAAFAGAYLPYAFTHGYVPRVFGVMNRVNMGGGLAAGILLAVFLDRFLPARPGSPWRRLAAAICLAAFALCHWMTGWLWMKAWDMQREILQDIRAQIPAGPATIVLRRTRPHLLGAPVFWSHYDISRAIQMSTGRRDIAANWAKAVSFEPGGLTLVNGDDNTFHYPYSGLYFYDGTSRRLVPVPGPGDPGKS